jgi:hypothetical protein
MHGQESVADAGREVISVAGAGRLKHADRQRNRPESGTLSPSGAQAAMWNALMRGTSAGSGHIELARPFRDGADAHNANIVLPQRGAESRVRRHGHADEINSRTPFSVTRVPTAS